MVRTSPDGNDVMVFKLDETGPARPNAGSAGSSADWTDHGNPVTGQQGLLGNAMNIPGTYLTSSIDGSGGANDVLITPNISISGWVYLKRITNYFGEVFNKQYFLNGWSSPFLTFGFQTDNTNDGKCTAYLTTGGTLHSVALPNAFYMSAGRWYHLGSTWDGTTLTFYLNGVLVNSATFTGTIDYGTAGNRGQWYVGGIPGSSTNQAAGILVQDIRIANVVRPQSYFANIYYNGMFVNG